MLQEPKPQNPQSSEAYYGQGPLVTLSSNVCIVGHRGCRSDKVVRYLGASLGLSYAILDDLVAHEVGLSPSAFCEREGIGPYRHVQATVLRKAVATKPYRLIAVSSDAATGMWTNYWLRKRTFTLWLELGFDHLLRNAREDRNLYPGLPAFITEAAYAKYLKGLWNGQNADIMMDVFASEPSVVSKQVITAMGWSIRQMAGPSKGVTDG